MRKILAIVFLLWNVTATLALSPDELLKDPVLEARARGLSAQLRCLVCQNQSIDDSDAPLAKDLRNLIREHLAKGKTDPQIMDYIVARYGEFVLLKPRFNGSTMVLWGMPFLVLLVAAGALFLQRRKINSLPEQPLTEAERQVLEKALE